MYFLLHHPQALQARFWLHLWSENSMPVQRGMVRALMKHSTLFNSSALEAGGCDSGQLGYNCLLSPGDR